MLCERLSQRSPGGGGRGGGGDREVAPGHLVRDRERDHHTDRQEGVQNLSLARARALTSAGYAGTGTSSIHPVLLRGGVRGSGVLDPLGGGALGFARGGPS